MPQLDLSECRGYVAAHLHASPKAADAAAARAPAVTISRQAGARGRTIGEKLRDALRERNPKAAVPWTLFDDNLVRKVLEDHQLPADLEKFMPDDAIGELEGSINEMLGRHPSLWTLFEKTVDTIVRLARLGNCIIVGRGANCITRGFANTLHVRLVGTEPVRLRRMMEGHGMSEKGARQFIKEEDAARRRYVKQHFSRAIDDPMIYDLVVNTDRLDDDAVVQTLMSALRAKRFAP